MKKSVKKVKFRPGGTDIEKERRKGGLIKMSGGMCNLVSRVNNGIHDWARMVSRYEEPEETTEKPKEEPRQVGLLEPLMNIGFLYCAPPSRTEIHGKDGGDGNGECPEPPVVACPEVDGAVQGYYCSDPNVDCNELIKNEIKSARRYVQIATYKFQQSPFTDVLENLAEDPNIGPRGIQLMISDLKGNHEECQRAIERIGLEVKVMDSFNPQIIVIDGVKVLVGTYDITGGSTKRSLTIIHSTGLAENFRQTINRLWRSEEAIDGSIACYQD